MNEEVGLTVSVEDHPVPPDDGRAHGRRQVAMDQDEIRRLESLLARYQRSDVWRRLVMAAVSAFAQRGFHATTTRDISRDAQMSVGAMYVHFPSKEDILFDVSLAAHASASEELAAGLVGLSAPHERLHAAVYVFTLWHAQNASLARIAQYESDALNDEHWDVVTRLRRQMQDVVVGVISHGVDSGDFTVTDVRTTTLAILSMSTDVSRWFRPEPHPSKSAMTAEEVATAYAETALRMVGYVG